MYKKQNETQGLLSNKTETETSKKTYSIQTKQNKTCPFRKRLTKKKSKLNTARKVPKQPFNPNLDFHTKLSNVSFNISAFSKFQLLTVQHFQHFNLKDSKSFEHSGGAGRSPAPYCLKTR